MTGQAAGERPGPDVQGPRASRRRAIWPLTRVPVAVVGLMVGLIGLTAQSASPRPAPSPGVNSAGTGTPRPGVIVTVAGGVGHGQGTNLGQNPASVAVGRNGDVYSSDDSFNVVRSVNPSSDAEQVDAGNGTKGSAGDRGPATAAQLHGPLGVALDADGNLFVADTAGNRVPVGGRYDRHALRDPDDQGRYLHGRRQRHQWILRRRRTGDVGPARSPGSGRRRQWQPSHHGQQPCPVGGGHDRHVRRAGHDDRRHLHRRRQRYRRVWR